MSKKDKIIFLYNRAMRLRDWYFVRAYPWQIRLKRHPLLAVRYALTDYWWYGVTQIKKTPFLAMCTFWGKKLKAPFPDYRSLLHHGLLDARELPVEEYLISHLTTEDVFFDIGANIGFYSALAQALDVPVHAFEPTPRTFEVLVKNVPGAIVINKALMEKEGTISFKDWGASKAGSNSVVNNGGNLTVEATTLDVYCKETSIHPTYIKIDVEEAELAVISGAKDTLQQYHPKLVIETKDQQVIKLLLLFGYKPYHFAQTSAAEILPYQLGERILSPNMLFLPG